MSWITVIWSMVASACLTLAAIYSLVWWKNRESLAPLWFSVTATSTAGFAFCELGLMRTQTPEGLDAALRWSQVPLSIWLVSLTWFVWTYLGAGRRWLAWTICGLRVLFVLPSLLMGGNPQLREIPSLQRVHLLGESVTVVAGVAKPWALLGPLTAGLVLIFVADASVTAWRRGDRRKALTIGGSVGFFLLTGSVMVLLVVWADLKVPQPLSLFYLGVVAVMGYELTRDVLRASRLVLELRATEAGLRESEARFRLMADTAPVMIWLAGVDGGYRFFNQRWLCFRGRALEAEAGDGWTEGIHPDDLTRSWDTYVEAFEARQPFHREYRLQGSDGEYCWMRDTGVPRRESDGSFAGYMGSSIDISDLKRAERDMLENQALLQASHQQISDLFGRLIAAQETERARIARDLHDDISQRIAGLSIRISAVRRKLVGQPEQIDVLAALNVMHGDTTALADQIRRVSHDLHPALLQHTGLVAALRGYCAEFETLHGVATAYHAETDLPPISIDTALCLYRIAQEALRNVAKHADASRATVALAHTADGLQLSIADNGKGFDLARTRGSGGGLGLVSMDERARLLRGTIQVRTHPTGGTSVQVQIPAT